MKIKIHTIIILSILVIILVAGLVILLDKKQQESDAPLDVSSKTQEEEEEEEEVKNITDKIYGFTAKITEINEKTLSLNGWVPRATEPPSSARIIVTGIVTDKTEILKLKFPEKSEQENKEKIYPEKTLLSFESLKVGDEINIATRKNITENIKNNTSFEIKTIFIVEK